MAYVVTALKPTAVRHALVGNFTSPEEFNLILCKVNVISVYTFSSAGGEGELQLVMEVPIYGKIATALLFKPKKEDKQDSLFISTEKYKFCVLTYDADSGEIITKVNGDIQDPNGKVPDVGQIVGIDPSGSIIGIHVWSYYYKLILIGANGCLEEEPYNMNLPEPNVIDIKFLHNCKAPTIAVLYLRPDHQRFVKTYELEKNRVQPLTGPWGENPINVEPTADTLIALPLGGLLVIGQESITYLNHTQKIHIPMKGTHIQAYGFANDKSNNKCEKILLGDFMGVISSLIVNRSNGNVELHLEPLGQTSRPSTISYLNNGYVFVGSKTGDSQLVKLETEKNAETGQYIDVVDNFCNLGSIVNFCVVDLDMQGQEQIVACCGAFQDSSIRVIRNGVGVNPIAQIPLPGIKGTWSLTPPPESKFEKYLAVSFVGETKILAMGGEELEETEIQGFLLDQYTLFCGNVAENQYVQITSKGVYLIDAVSEKLSSSWTPPADSKISVCTANFFQVAIASKGKDLLVFEIGNKELKLIGQKTMPHDIACISLDPIGKSNEKASVCAVGLWTDISVRILVLPHFTEIKNVEIGGEVIPRSLKFKTFDDQTYLFIALGDGRLISFNYNLNTGALENRKNIAIGTRPVTLNEFKGGNTDNVFATSDRPVVIHQSLFKKLLYTNVNLKEVNYMCDFDCSSFPSALALATENSLTIGTLDQLQQLHIRTVNIGCFAFRISHMPSSQSFCVLTIGESHSVVLLDDQTFEVKDTFLLKPGEEGASLITTQFAGDDTDYFVVGTVVLHPEEKEPREGRILALSVKDDKFKLQAELTVRGAVYSLSPLRGKLVAAINSEVHLFKWKGEERKHLAKEYEHRGHVLAIGLDTRDDFILVADLMKSLSCLQYNPNDLPVIKTNANDCHQFWPRTCKILSDDTFLAAENEGNIYILEKNGAAVTQEDRLKLELTGKYHIGDEINSFQEGSLVARFKGESPDFSTTLIYGGVGGSIGVIAMLESSTFQWFQRVEKSIKKFVKGIGGFDHGEWRSFNANNVPEPSAGFIDGDLVESFLELPQAQMELISKDLQLPLEEIIATIENIARGLH